MSQLDLLTPDEEVQFREQGFLLLRSVLAPNEVDSLLAEVQRLVETATSSGRVLREKYYHANSFKLIRIMRLSSSFDALIDHPGYFGKLVSLFGTYLQLMGAEIFVRGPAQEAITGFHTDLGAGLQRILPEGQNPFLQVKVQLFLTDLVTRDSSNFALVPGSHRRRVSDSDELCMIKDVNDRIGPAGELPPDVLQVLARAGDALLFPHSLWHGVAPNHSGRTRYSIALRYGQLALRPFERFDPVLTDTGRSFTARQRRLLGDLGVESASPYRPPNQDEIILGGAGAGMAATAREV